MNATIFTKRRAAIYCIFGATTLCALSTSVGATEDVPSMPSMPYKRVRFDDLNIADPSGAKVLYRRIRAAAREVCARYDNGDRANRTPFQACVEKAIEDGVMKVNAPTLTALVSTRSIR
jgi:UrcA family protein